MLPEHFLPIAHEKDRKYGKYEDMKKSEEVFKANER